MLPAPRLPAGHVPMRDFLPGQCLLLVDTALMYVDKNNLWLDGLYVRLKDVRDPEGIFGQIIGVGRSNLQVWMTNITLQGNGDGVQDCSYCGLYIWWSASGYCEGAVPALPLKGLSLQCSRDPELMLSAVNSVIPHEGQQCSCRMPLCRLRWPSSCASYK